MLHAPDGWTALGITAQLVLLMQAQRPFDLSSLSRNRYGLFLLLVLLTLGTKEVAFAFQVVLLAALFWRSAGFVRLVPIVGLLGFWTYRLHQCSGRASGATPSLIWDNFLKHLNMLAPAAPLYSLHVALAAALLCAIVLAWRKRHTSEGLLILVAIVAGVAMLLMTSVLTQPALRYTVPSVHLFALAAGLAARQYLSRSNRTLWLAALALPLISAGEVYSQELAYQQAFYEYSEVTQLLESKAVLGAPIAITGDPDELSPEGEWTIKMFFGSEGPRLYGTAPRTVVTVRESGWPTGFFVLLSQKKPEDLFRRHGNQLEFRRLRQVQCYDRGHYGLLERLTNAFLTLDGIIKRPGGYYVDVGAPMLSDEPAFYVYSFGEGTPPHDLSGPTAELPAVQKLAPFRRYGAFGY